MQLINGRSMCSFGWWAVFGLQSTHGPHIFPASLSPPLPSGWQDQAVTMGNSGWATFSTNLSPELCLDLQPFNLPYYITNKHWSGGHRAKDSVVSANVNSDKDEKVFDHGDSCRKPRMKHWSRHSSEGGKQRRERHQQVLCRTSWLCSSGDG